MAFTLSQIATALGAVVEGDASLQVVGASEPASARADQLALAMDPKYGDGLAQGAAKAAILWQGADWQALGLEAAIFVPRPRYAMSGLTTLMDSGPEIAPGVHAMADVHPQGDAAQQSWTRIHSLGAVTIGNDVEIGANAAIDRGTIRDTSIGDGTKLDNLVHIGHNVQIGRDCLLCGQVGIAGSSRIGDRVVMAGQCGVNDNIFVGDDVIAGGATKIFTNAPAGRKSDK